MRVRALVLIGCLVWASSAMADEKSDFEKARIAYVKKDYLEATARFEAMLDPSKGTLKTKDLVVEAEFCFGAVKFAQNKKDEARKLWEKVVLDTSGQYQPDALTYPADVLNTYIDVRDHMKEVIQQQQAREAAEAAAQRERDAKERARLEARVKELEKIAASETVEVRSSRWTALMPFGIGQFQNQRNGLGWFFLLTESAAVLGTCALFFPYRYNVDHFNAVLSDPTPMSPQSRRNLANQYALVAQDIRTADFITLGALGALVLTGIIEAQINYKPLFTTTRARKISEVWPSLSPLPGAGAEIGVQGRF